MLATTYDGWTTFKRRWFATWRIIGWSVLFICWVPWVVFVSWLIGLFVVLPWQAGLCIFIAAIFAPFISVADKIILAFPGLMLRFTNAPGTARWGNLRDLKDAGLIGTKRDRTKDIYCGMFKGNRVYYGEDRHAVTAGPTRSGKDMRFLVENLRNLNRSVVVMDPKGELAAITANHRRKFGPVLVINPFSELVPTHPHLKSVGFNPLVGLSPKDDEFYSKSMAIAEALVQIEGKDPHWSRRGQSLVAALVMGTKWLEQDRTIPLATMGHVKSMLMSPYSGEADMTSLYDILKRIAKHHDEQVADTARAFLDADSGSNEELKSSINTARGQLKCMNDGALIRDLSRHPQIRRGKDLVPFDFEMLKHQVMTVYLILPAKRLETHAVWLRLLVSCALQSLSGIPGKVRPILMLNEAGNLGHLAPLRTAMGIAAGMGVTIWTIWQSLSQIMQIYDRHGFETFMSGAGFVNSLRAKDLETARYLSERIGNKTEVVTSYNASQKKSALGMPTKNELPSSFPLMYPDQIMGMKAGTQLALIDPCPRPFKLDAPSYWEFGNRGMEPNPYYVAR